MEPPHSQLGQEDVFSAKDSTHSIAKIRITHPRKLKIDFVLTEVCCFPPPLSCFLSYLHGDLTFSCLDFFSAAPAVLSPCCQHQAAPAASGTMSPQQELWALLWVLQEWGRSSLEMGSPTSRAGPRCLQQITSSPLPTGSK